MVRSASSRGRLGGGRRGQALLVAVLLMMAILLVGILFVALVTYNQAQSTRHEDLLAAQALAEAGIRYATEQLENSPCGADWRPPEPPAEYSDGAFDSDFWGSDGVPDTDDDYYASTDVQRGWSPLIDQNTGEYVRRGFTRLPDPRRPAGNPTMGRGYFLLRVSYEPWEPGDPGTPDPINWNLKIESIGRVDGTQVFRRLVAYKPVPLLNYARWVHNATNTGRPAQLGIPPYIDMNNDGAIAPATATAPSVEWLSTTIRGPVRVNGPLQVAGAPALDPNGAIMEASTKFELLDRVSPDGYPRRDLIEVAEGITLMDDIANAAEVTVDDGTDLTTGYVLPSTDPNFDPMGGYLRDGRAGTAVGGSRFVARLSPPQLTLGDGTTGLDRYRALTRDSGGTVEFPSGSGEFVNSGQWGFGAGIYIDNWDDVQFNHNIEQLLTDWQRPNSRSGITMADSGWNALLTTYSPPGVEISFLPTETVPGTAWGELYSDTAPAPPGKTWWPNHTAGQPGIMITRYDKTWRKADGSDSGERTIVFDYPTPWLDGAAGPARYPVILAEGNVRVTGQLPPALTDGTGLARRKYDMLVVSGGTIYIEGQLLRPNNYLDPPVDEEFNSTVALLARDCVCLNATQIVPQLTSGTAPAAPDDPLNPSDLNKHWELAPGSDGAASSNWFWGGTADGAHVALVVRQAAADPGPSGVSLTPWVSGTGYTNYVFGTPPAPMVGTTFALVPPGTVFPDGAVPPQPYGVEAVAPQWAPYRDAAAGLPWDLATHVDPTPGLSNALVLRHADPHLGAGSTSYWLKKWKIAEYNDDNLPVGAINAQVNAVVFAERGCWYVLSGDYFDPELTGDEAVENRRYNYRLTFTGAIAENFTASVEAAQDWTDKLAYPAEYTSDTIASLSRWGTIDYNFDETLRTVRFHGTVADPVNPAANLPRMPLQPVSPDLVYYGEAQ